MIGTRKRSIVENTVQERKQQKAVVGRQQQHKGRGGGGRWVDPMDFIDFILNHDSLTEEFCYMTRTGNSGGAYDLQIVPFSQINPYDYYTISLRGVTSFRRGSIEFTPLHVWQRDQALYKRVMNIPFFAKYRKWKLYTIWRSAVIRQRMRKCRNVLSKSLFILDPTLSSALLAVRKECVKVSNWSLLDLTTPTSKPGTKMAPVGQESYGYRGYGGGRGTGQRGARFKWPISDSQTVQMTGAGGCCCRIEDFTRAQEACREKLSKDLEGVWSGVKDTVMMACARSLSDFLIANGFHQPANLRGVLEILEDQVKDEGDNDADTPPASADDHLPSYTEQATTRTKCRRLVKFIRTCEYILSDSVSAMCFRSTEGFLGLLDKYMKQIEAEEERRRNESTSGAAAAEKSSSSLLLSRAGTMKSILTHHIRAGNLGGPEGVSIERPIFIVECTFIPGEGGTQHRRGVHVDQYSRLEFSPSGQDFRVFIEESLMESLRAVSSCPSFLALPEFQPFIAPLAEVATTSDLPTASSSSSTAAAVSALSNNEQLREVLNMISNRVENLFQKVMDYTETYQRFVEMYDENEGVNIEEEFGPQAELAVYRNGLVK
ncbi:hypothetical protein FOL47_010653 [Perkinsus chesapeaki]|uniref:Uncharacterized protein n=1 Tax=Perkinsus chesapeaki TaxID=330153 RepID=A0A7J6L360_PERCH|nr:hypothetical protein FOL47_010653 [Perkinsus chesapeaki]